jgi:hypothetical protein
MVVTKERALHSLFMMVFFACLGVTTEVIFTAAASVVNNEPLCGNSLYSLAGKSYVWMIFIYALIPWAGHLVVPRVERFPFYIRLALYVSIIYLVEFLSGYLLRQITGKCPWEYHDGLNFMGLIRLDYLPAWLLFCWILERLYIFINNKVIQ